MGPSEQDTIGEEHGEESTELSLVWEFWVGGQGSGQKKKKRCFGRAKVLYVKATKETEGKPDKLKTDHRK